MTDTSNDESPGASSAERPRGSPPPQRRSLAELPSAWTHRHEIQTRLKDRLPALFLDYDGTLTAIVERPELAHLPETTRDILDRLLDHCPVTVVSGRGLADVQEQVGLEGLIYAGSHGFQIDGPRDLSLEQPEARRLLPRLDSAQKRLEAALGDIPGALVERKRFSIATHYRNVRPQEVERLKEVVEDVLEDYPGLQRRGGKMVVELQPAVDWDKGKAVAWLLDELELDGPEVLPFYLGDDLTDEDALRLLAHRAEGVGIAVGDEERPTWAHYRLADPAEVERWLADLLAHLKSRPRARCA